MQMRVGSSATVASPRRSVLSAHGHAQVDLRARQARLQHRTSSESAADSAATPRCQLAGWSFAPRWGAAAIAAVEIAHHAIRRSWLIACTLWSVHVSRKAGIISSSARASAKTRRSAAEQAKCILAGPRPVALIEIELRIEPGLVAERDGQELQRRHVPPDRTAQTVIASPGTAPTTPQPRPNSAGITARAPTRRFACRARAVR